MQISSGILSIGLGVVFAASFPIDGLLLTLFRVTIVTGILFVAAGFFSLMLHRNPRLLQICFHSNIFCLVISIIGTVLLCADLISFIRVELSFQVELLVLFVTLFDMLISIVLIFLIHAEKRRQRKK
ncbi:uncharacterized protein si:ch211-269k10.4 isoform X2 [Tachysurus fulvidraco]|nr:uncharacterized protein si:ch211-269k10.4 isoform X2 [Tachysurus fulvidraco]